MDVSVALLILRLSVKHPRFVELSLGPLPVELINATLGLELEAGEVVFSVAAQKHVEKRHPDDYRDFLAFTGTVICNPSYIGQAPKHWDKIEMVRRMSIHGKEAMLVALSLEARNGVYHVASFYTISEVKISNRRQNGTLKVPKR